MKSTNHCIHLLLPILFHPDSFQSQGRHFPPHLSAYATHESHNNILCLIDWLSRILIVLINMITQYDNLTFTKLNVKLEVISCQIGTCDDSTICVFRKQRFNPKIAWIACREDVTFLLTGQVSGILCTFWKVFNTKLAYNCWYSTRITFSTAFVLRTYNKMNTLNFEKLNDKTEMNALIMHTFYHLDLAATAFVDNWIYGGILIGSKCTSNITWYF